MVLIKEKGKETEVDTEKRKLYKVLNKVNRVVKTSDKNIGCLCGFTFYLYGF